MERYVIIEKNNSKVIGIYTHDEAIAKINSLKNNYLNSFNYEIQGPFKISNDDFSMPKPYLQMPPIINSPKLDFKKPF